jgi:DNA replication protein DnaC
VKPSEIPLDAFLKRLNLANTRRVYRDLVQRAEKESWSCLDFLSVLAAEEVSHRQGTRLQRLVRRARFPFLKTIDEYDFAYQTDVRIQMLGSFLSPDFVTEGRCLILSGKTGRGKTHLAVAIAYRAVQNGFDALFTTAEALIADLSAAGRDGNLREALAEYTHPHVLVIDEVGYLSYGPDAANVLFHVVNERHLRRRPMIFTTNKPLDSWGKVLHDPDLAAAIIDRILERGRILKLDGPSMRTKHLELDTSTPEEASSSEPAIISGKHRPEFPEPTSFKPDSGKSPDRDRGANPSGRLLRHGARHVRARHEGEIHDLGTRKAVPHRLGRPGEEEECGLLNRLSARRSDRDHVFPKESSQTGMLSAQLEKGERNEDHAPVALHRADPLQRVVFHPQVLLPVSVEGLDRPTVPVGADDALFFPTRVVGREEDHAVLGFGPRSGPTECDDAHLSPVRQRHVPGRAGVLAIVHDDLLPLDLGPMKEVHHGRLHAVVDADSIRLQARNPA